MQLAHRPDPTERDVENAQIQAACSILDRRLRRGEFLESPQAAGALAKLKLAGCEREVFAAMFLDTRHRLIKFEELFTGTVDGAVVHPREVVKSALLCNAAAVVVAHNHPSGLATPSAADRAITTQLKQALAIVEIRLLDHFVVGDGAPVSMAALGWL